MTAASVHPGNTTIPVPRLGFVLLALCAMVIWLVGFEVGPASEALGQGGGFLHELFHDGRHLLGAPCH